MDTVKLLGSRLLLEEVPEETESGSIIQGIPEFKDTIGIVKYVGEALEGSFSEGQKVQYIGGSLRVNVKGKEYKLVIEENVIAIIDDEKKEN